MKLSCIYNEHAAGNPYFQYIFNSIYDEFKKRYLNHDIIHEQPSGDCFSCPGGQVNFQITNRENRKTILMSFWDRGGDVFLEGLGWEDYILVQYIGGLSMAESSAEIKRKYNVEHIPYQYPLGVPNSYDYVDKHRVRTLDNKTKKAVFIGMLHGKRLEITNFMQGHSLVEIIDHNQIYHGESYFKKLSNYIMGISLNGNGEIGLRDFELMGMGLPVVRSELLTQFYNPLIPNTHYIRGSEPCSQAGVYSRMDSKKIADQFITAIETSIDDYDKLSELSKTGLHYFDNYCKPDYMINLFFDLIKIDELA